MNKNRLKELTNKEDIAKLTNLLELSNSSIIYQWQNNQKGMSLKSATIIANFFECTLDYLYYRTDDDKSLKNNINDNFGIQLKKILEQENSSQYQLIKNGIVSANTLNTWMHNKSIPNMESIIKIADFLNISIDYLVGRE